jgi:hypothetical protein
MANMRITMENFQFITIKIIKIRCKMNKNIIFDCTLKKKDKRKKMCCVSARRLSIHKTYNKFKNKFAE